MTTTTVSPGTVAVVRVDGRTTAVLGPGRHRLPMAWRWWRREVERVDTRRATLLLTGQEVAAADVPGVGLSAALTWRVADAERWLDVSADPLGEVRLALQVALRDWAASAALEELLAGRARAGETVAPAVRAAAEAVGVAVEGVVVRDVVVPGEVRRAVTALATAQLEGRAQLERARGEVAALRALQNAGRMLADNPALLQLRTVETAARTGGEVRLTVAPPPG
ncbi:SPFH domain-containing protein [Aquipuribacter sp. SD81]|uniref:SPFH domain-containing protein n=1 Tax=Aquipuribacter sp. SD81 TaxID=3127703 RepID=UPI003018A0D0